MDGTGDCTTCCKRVLIRKPDTKHLLHLVASICTLGIWLPIWSLVAMIGMLAPWRCSVCGSKVSRSWTK